MRVCQILYSGLGGHGSVAFSIIDGGSLQTSHSMIFYGIENLIKDYEDKCSDRNVRFKFVKKKSGLDLNSFLKIYKSLKILNPDVIILHSNTIIIPVWFFSFLKRKRLISVEHTPINVKTKKDWVFSILNNRLSHKVVLLTKSFCSAYFRAIPIILSQRKVSIIPNGIDTAYFKPLTRDAGEDKQLIGMLSRLSPSKDHETLIMSMKILKDRSSDLILNIAGDGEEKESLENLVNQFELNHQIAFLGLIKKEQILKFFADIDIYVHTSISETMSTSIMQAMASGKPIIAANIEGVKNLIEVGKTGILFEPGNPEDLAKKIIMLKNNSRLRTLLSIEARRFAIDYLSQEKMSESYHNLFIK